MDTTWNKYDGIKIKPRVRGRIKLPTLENRLSLVLVMIHWIMKPVMVRW